MLNYVLVGVIVVMGAYIFLLERNRKNIIQAWDEDIERLRRERDEHYAERDEERQEQEDKEQELIKELRKNKIQQATSLFRVMFRRYCEAGIPNCSRSCATMSLNFWRITTLTTSRLATNGTCGISASTITYKHKQTPLTHHRGSFSSLWKKRLLQKFYSSYSR
ncbi:MAG: hypothetical protein IJR85_08800 [Synergistaceae bacterium]|nr:hypothetical protein [Synergistaceae bacterium]